MMGNFACHGYQSLEPVEHCGCNNSRTTDISEPRLKLIKRTILHGEASLLIDHVSQILTSHIRETQIDYSNLI